MFLVMLGSRHSVGGLRFRSRVESGSTDCFEFGEG